MKQLFFFLYKRRPPTSPLFPYSTLFQSAAPPPVNGHAAFPHRREPEKRADLDVVRADREGRGAERRAPFDGERVAAEPVDLGALASEKARQVLHVGLAGGLTQHCGARGRDGGPEGGLWWPVA